MKLISIFLFIFLISSCSHTSYKGRFLASGSDEFESCNSLVFSLFRLSEGKKEFSKKFAANDYQHSMIDYLTENGYRDKKWYSYALKLENEYQIQAFIKLLQVKEEDPKVYDLLFDLKDEVKLERFIEAADRPGKERIHFYFYQALYEDKILDFYQKIDKEEFFNWVGVKESQKRGLKALVKRNSKNPIVATRANLMGEKSSYRWKSDGIFLKSRFKKKDNKLKISIDYINIDYKKLKYGKNPKEVSFRFGQIISAVYLAAIKEVHNNPEINHIELVGENIVNKKLIGMLREMGFHVIKTINDEGKWLRLNIYKQMDEDADFSKLTIDAMKKDGRDIDPSRKYVEQFTNEAQFRAVKVLIQTNHQIANKMKYVINFDNVYQPQAMHVLINGNRKLKPSLPFFEEFNNEYQLEALKLLIHASDEMPTLLPFILRVENEAQLKAIKEGFNESSDFAQRMEDILKLN